MSVIPAGNYSARPISHGLGESKTKGTPYAEVRFQTADGSEVTWQGWLTDGALPYTLKKLVTLGFSGSDPIELAGDRFLLSHDPVTIVVEHETNEKGSTYPKVAAIFAPRPTMTPQQAKVKLGAMNLKGQLAAIRAEMGVKAPTQQAQTPKIDDTDLPF